ncbi:MAG: hypothetical protein J6W06_12285 [Bacteroidales bacterium]|nr:hypothetical protein [Bacteroidales bacterium]
MKKLITIAIIFFSAFGTFAQNVQFDNFLQKIKQNFDDKGYKMQSETIGKISDTLPIVSDTLMLEADTYYNIVAASDNCSYCILKLYFVDSENNMHPLEFEVTENYDERFNYRIYKNRCNQYEVGRYVLMINSELPYDMGLFVYKKTLY